MFSGELGKDESRSDKFLRQGKASQIISLLPSKQAQSSKIGYSVTRYSLISYITFNKWLPSIIEYNRCQKEFWF